MQKEVFSWCWVSRLCMLWSAQIAAQCEELRRVMWGTAVSHQLPCDWWGEQSSTALLCRQEFAMKEHLIFQNFKRRLKEVQRKKQFEKCASYHFCIYILWTIQALRFYVLTFMTSKIPLLQSTFLIWSQEYQQGSCMLCIHVLRAEMVLNALHGLFSELCL